MTIQQVATQPFSDQHPSTYNFNCEALQIIHRIAAANKMGPVVVGCGGMFTYDDPVDGSRAEGQGLRTFCRDNARIEYFDARTSPTMTT
jgi:hypothetical protein